MDRLNHWIEAFRPKTLPLALAGMVMGNFLAASGGYFHWDIAVFSILTALLLQILSNLANDYGDYKNGADTEKRVGPRRMVQRGMISVEKMKRAVILVASLSFLSGIILLFLSYPVIGITGVGIFLGLGILAILAAYAYTASDRPYGYAGLGDAAVVIFFGILAVGGVYYLHAGSFNYFVLLPAATIGLFSAGVLNTNNLRDLPTDKASGKKTIPVRLGLTGGKIYHAFLILTGMASTIIFAIIIYLHWWQFLFLAGLIPFVVNVFRIFSAQTPEDFIPYLKQLALSTFVFSIVFGLSLMF